MNYQNASLPDNAEYVSSTPEMTENTAFPEIRKKHMAPKGKCGLLSVAEGRLQFIWEDSGEIIDADPGHPVVIFPERYHHVVTPAPVRFHIEFYSFPSSGGDFDSKAERPGARFVK